MKILLSLLIALSSFTLQAQISHFSGTWTKINTTYQFDFDLMLKHTSDGQVEGHFQWKVINYDEGNFLSIAHYETRLGLTGTEYVKGTFNPETNEYILKGYRKDDPNLIIGLDTYQLKVEKGNLGGTTSADGTWLGRIHGRETSGDNL